MHKLRQSAIELLSVTDTLGASILLKITLNGDDDKQTDCNVAECYVTFQRFRIKAFFSAMLLATHLYTLSKCNSNSGTSCSNNSYY